MNSITQLTHEYSKHLEARAHPLVPPLFLRLDLPLVVVDLSIDIIDHLLHRLQMFPLLPRRHAGRHHLSKNFLETDLPQHQLPPRLHPRRHQDTFPHHRLHRLRCKLNSFFRFSGHSRFVQHHDLCSRVVFLDISVDAEVVSAAAAHEGFGDFVILRGVAPVMVDEYLSGDTRDGVNDVVSEHAELIAFLYQLVGKGTTRDLAVSDLRWVIGKFLCSR